MNNMKINIPMRAEGIIHDEYNLPLKLEHPQVQKCFTRGHCHSLAFALNKITGHPIVGFSGYYGLKHLAVKVGRKVLDIEGLSSIKEAKTRWNAKLITKNIKKEMKNGEWYSTNITKARPFAKLLVKKYLKK